LNYLEFSFAIPSNEEYQRDLLISALSEAGFDTFEETPFGFNAYIPQSSFEENLFNDVLSSYKDDFAFSWERREVAQANWNEVWESNFEPLVILNQCYVRATFHHPKPEYPFEIVVDPKMAFGTGHHQTTTMMMEFILEENFAEKKVLDMGAGTGILAILAAKRGAAEITAIDYDPICYDSILENTRLNNTPVKAAFCGSKEAIPNERFDILLANINRNILLDQMDKYAESVETGGELYISGFYKEDVEILKQKANSLNFSYAKLKILDNWCAIKFLKQN
jgi:ribosomal protein L11 methyltransferase